MKKKIRYEEAPWGDDEPILGKVVKDFLPSPAEFRKARLKIEQGEAMSIAITAKERKLLEKQAKKVGLTAEGLLAGIIADYVQQLPSSR